MKNFDLIFMDIKMTSMNGFEALARIRKLGITTPIIIYTAESKGSSTKIEVKKAGFDGFLAKPTKIEDIFSIIKRFAN